MVPRATRTELPSRGSSTPNAPGMSRESRNARCTRSRETSSCRVASNRSRTTSSAACARAPAILKFEPRRFTDTVMRSSMSRRFSSSGPQRFASRELSGGTRSNSRTGSMGAGADISSTIRRDTRFVPWDDAHQTAAQRLRARLDDDHVDEMANEARGSGKVHPAAVFRAARELRGVFLRRTGDQHSLSGPHHLFADGARLGVQLLLQPRQALLLYLVGDIVWQRGRGRTRALAIDESERLIEIGFAHELECGLEIAVRLAGKPDNDVSGNRDIGAHRAQAPQFLLEFERGVAALHRSKNAVRAGLHC